MASAVTAFYMLETPYFLKVADEEGREKWVAKHKLTAFRVSECDVHLQFKDKYREEAAELLPPPKYRLRNCPRCKRTFQAKAQYRYCDPCKESEPWRYARASFDL